MKTKNGWTLFETTAEIGPWLNKQSVSRKINRLQVHHMGLPDYKTWNKTDKRVFSDPYFGRTESLDNYGKTTWRSKSANGKYIAQHFNVFPDGKITTGRSLNSNPIGITGWNTGAICVEIYGNFDKGQDIMTEAQQKAVIALFGELCKRFKLTPSANTIRYHAWFTSNGTYLGDYQARRSRKSCPGTNFFGGNTMAAFNKNFLPAMKNYIKTGSLGSTTPVKETTTSPIAGGLDKLIDATSPFKKYIARCTAKTLNCRRGPGTAHDIMLQIKKGDVFTVVAEQGDWAKSASGYWVHKAYIERVRDA